MLAFLDTAFSVFFAIIAAFTLERLQVKGRKFIKILMLLPLVNPSFIGSLSIIMLFGKSGLITHQLLGLTVSPYGLHGVLLLRVLSSITTAYLIIASALKKSDVDLENAARNMGASEGYILTHISLPLMVPEILTAALLAFFSSMADFAAPSVIGGNFHTLASELYIQIIGVYDMKSASVIGAVLLCPCLLVFFLQLYIARKKTYGNESSTNAEVTYEFCPSWIRKIFIAITVVEVFFFCMIFIFIFVGAFTKAWGHDYTPTLKHAKAVFDKGFRVYLKPLMNSIKLSLVTGFFTALLGTINAYLIHEKKMPFSRFVEFVCILPAAVPGILFGIGYLVTFKYPILGIGDLWMKSFPKVILLGTASIVYIICIARQLNLSMKTCMAMLDHMDMEQIDAAHTMGASNVYTLLHVIVPSLRGAFMNTFLRIFSTTMSTLGAIIFLILPANKVIIQIMFQRISSDTMGVSCFVALLLSGTTFGIMLLFYTIGKLPDLCYMWKRRRAKTFLRGNIN